ncbi:MAG: hypothetical protein N3D80_07400 [Ignavibacterium album]|uniref:hypothetical protein n=1 Tax=Ignavibacterium album TaxID=591197 RepID=UPI0026EBE384|nr:hypothetical protein [Ignavibacterium album]MCX8105676.1 hypothetical protein [Ignavibacterium album]
MDSNTIIIMALIVLFGLFSILINRSKSITIYYANVGVILIAILVILIEAITNVDKRYISLLFVLIGLGFLYKQYKLIKNVKANSENRVNN